MRGLYGKIILCHINKEDPESFVAGKLLASDTGCFVLKLISPAGRWDGYALYMRSDVVSIDSEDQYIDCLKILLSNRVSEDYATPDLEGNLLIDLLNYAKTYGLCASIELFKSGEKDVIGFINTVDNSFTAVEQLNEFGERDGESLVRTGAITRVHVADDDCECIRILAMHKAKR